MIKPYRRIGTLFWKIYSTSGLIAWTLARGDEDSDFYDDGFCILCGNNAPFCRCPEIDRWLDDS